MKRVRRGLVIRQWPRRRMMRGITLGWDYVHPLCVAYLHRPHRARPASKFTPIPTWLAMQWQNEDRGVG